MTKISRNSWILDPITFLTVVPSSPSPPMARPLEGDQDTVRPYSLPGTRLYSQHRQNWVLWGPETLLVVTKSVAVFIMVVVFAQEPTVVTFRKYTYLSLVAQAPLSFPGFCPVDFYLPQSLRLTKPTHHASYYLHIFAHARSLLLRLPPFHSTKFYFSSRESFFPLL